MKLIRSIVMSVCVCAGAFGAVEPETVELRPKYVVGQEDRFVAEIESTRAAKFVDSQVNRPESYKQILRVHRKVIEANTEGATIELVFEAADVSIVAGRKIVRYDSEGINGSEPELTLGTSVKSAINRPVRVQVDAYGRPLKVSGNGGDAVTTAAGSLMGDEVFMKMLVPLYGLGKEPAATKIETGWSEERKSKGGQTGVITTTLDYTLKGLEGKLAKIAIDGKMSLEPSEKAREAKTTIDEQSIVGEVVWDTGAGSVRNYRYNLSMKLLAETEGKMRMALTGYSLSIRWLEVWPPVSGSTTGATTGEKK